MGGRQARLLCPRAVVVPPRMSAYSAASRAVFEVFKQTTPLVEGLSIDEAFLDVAGLRRISGTPTQIAVRLRQEVRAQVGLPITVGVARTKFLAKVASGVAKPDGLLVVPPDAELAFLHRLPIERLWGVGPVTARKLRERRITTVGHVARLGEPALVSMLGAAVRWARSGPWAARRARPKTSTPSSRVWSTGSAGGCAQPGGRVARSCCGCGSTTSPGPPARTR
jgi:DNA polymerase-4